jgi:hypothetical protein
LRKGEREEEEERGEEEEARKDRKERKGQRQIILSLPSSQQFTQTRVNAKFYHTFYPDNKSNRNEYNAIHVFCRLKSE